MGKKKPNGEEPPRVSGQSNEPLSRPIHALPIAQFLEEIRADAGDGLTSEEARLRLEQHGKNDFGESEGVQPAKIFISQFTNALSLVVPPAPAPLPPVPPLVAPCAGCRR